MLSEIHRLQKGMVFKMKKTMIKRGNLILQMAAVLGMMICISGCGKDPAETEKQGQGNVVSDPASMQGSDTVPGASGSSSKEENEAVGYCFTANGVTVSVDMDMDELAAKLGERKSMYTVPSCTGEGLTYVYDFSAYEIETYPAADGKNRIGSVYFKNDMIATAEGIDLSMTKADVLRVYGEDCEESANKITYEKDGMKLNFLFEGENMVSIEYVSAVIG